MHLNRNLIPVLAAIAAVSLAAPAIAADSRAPTVPASAALSYADIADLADSAPMVIRAQVRKLVTRERPGQHVGEVEHSKAVQRGGRGSHRWAPGCRSTQAAAGILRLPGRGDQHSRAARAALRVLPAFFCNITPSGESVSISPVPPPRQF